MAGRYKPYSEYKDSGVEWLGEIPKDWTVSKIKFIAPYQVGWTPPTKNDANFEGENLWANISDLREKVIYDTAKKISDAAAEAASMDITPAGSLMYSFKLSVGAVSFAGGDMYTNEAIASFLEGAELPLSYLYYVLPKFVIENASTNIYGARILNQELISNAMMLAPSFREAEKIASFLDHETAKIDTLIEKQQQLIQLLKEKRQAVISHAVTKGLSSLNGGPSVKMRDSGVEWLGEVPEHWVPSRLKYLKALQSNSFVDGPFGSNLKSEHFVEDGDVYVIESNFATTGDIDASKLKKISSKHFESIKRSSTEGGDIIIAKIGARYGSSSILPDLDKAAVVSGNSLKLTVNEDLLVNKYANELLRFLKANDAMDDGVNITAQPALSLGGLNNLPFLMVPINEQIEIVSYVQSVKIKFDRLIESSNAFVELAKERRTALISAAVTGEIDVRDWVAPPASQTHKEVAA